MVVSSPSVEEMDPSVAWERAFPAGHREAVVVTSCSGGLLRRSTAPTKALREEKARAISSSRSVVTP